MRRTPEATWDIVPYVEDFSSLEELRYHAVRPSRISIVVELETQDRLLVYYLEKGPPVVIRMTLSEILRARAELMRLEIRYVN